MLLSIKGSKLKIIYEKTIKDLTKLKKSTLFKLNKHKKEHTTPNCMYETTLQSIINALEHKIFVLEIVIDNLSPKKAYTISVEELALQTAIPYIVGEQPEYETTPNNPRVN